jgi:hypothetical protein
MRTMSGIINGASTRDATPPQGGLNNPLLRQAEDKVESGLTPANRANYMRVVVAGLHAALNKGAGGGMASLRNSKDPVADAANGAVALVLTMQKQAKGIMPVKAMIPAGMTLMLHALDFIDRAGITKVAEPELVRASTIFTNTLFAKLGITSAMLQHAAGAVHAITQDPTKMAAINLKAGFTRHPMAATPTPLPGPTTAAGAGGEGEAA